MARNTRTVRNNTASVKDDTREDTSVRHEEDVVYPTKAEVDYHKNEQKKVGFVDDILSLDRVGIVHAPDQKVDADPLNEAGVQEGKEWYQKTVNYFKIPEDWVQGFAVYPDMVVVVYEPKRDYRYPDIAPRIKVEGKSLKKIFFRRASAAWESRHYKK